MALKQGGFGGVQPPSFAHKMIRIALPLCKHGDGMRRFFSRSMDGPRGSKGNSDDNYEDRDPDPTIPATVDMFQTPGSEGLKDDPQMLPGPEGMEEILHHLVYSKNWALRHSEISK